MTHKDILTPNTPGLAFGAMRMPEIDLAGKMVDTYLGSGYNYFDTAYAYAGSEELLKKTLVKRHPRNSYMLANKLPNWLVKKPGDAKDLLEESLKRCGLDYFDFYLIHSLADAGEQRVIDMELFEFACEQKKRGLVKHVGFSFHGTTPYLERLLNRYPDVEFVMLQLNYLDILRGQAGQWQQLALKHNKPILVMEPVKGGTLAALPPQAEALFKAHDPARSIASWAVQYAATLEGATAMLSGMSTMEQLEDNLKTFQNLKPLTQEEMVLIESVLVEMGKVASVPCTACKYCLEPCPQGIDIAKCFTLYNDVKRNQNQKWNATMMYGILPQDAKAHNCTSCGLCVPHCPQHIDIPQGLKEVDDLLTS